ncbi:AI-2E family transporter [Mucilaginibacter sp. X4EP1]|uniref:AI-2E family transporter n=1 Tax=Mucilaginibacter sp. X4EP1 TaxID=2723092 RepID=UPI002169AF07|nr:AI-2E family transporter [Mucilaginibacter sp. X4EP1]MCS3816550.1 putative PurR-regulated permease PerM [Mucilaginibacter sp. X4EP1]
MDKEPTKTIKKELSYTLKVWQTMAIVCLSLIIILFVRVAFNILLMTFMGVLIAVYFHGLADLIAQKTKINRKLSLFISIAGTIILLNVMVWIIGSTVQQQAAQLSHTLPQIISTAKTKLAGSSAGQQLLGYTSGDNSKKLMDTASTFFSSSFGVIGDLYIILFLGIFFTANPSVYKNSLLAIVPSQQEIDGSMIWDRISAALKGWLKTKLVSMVLVTIVVAIGLTFIGLPGTLVLGLIAGLLDIIPNFGPVIAMVPGVLLGLMISPQMAVIAALIYVICETIVGSIFMPLINKKMINIPPAITMISQLVMGVICGLMGIILAVPILLVLSILVDELYIKKKKAAKSNKQTVNNL